MSELTTYWHDPYHWREHEAELYRLDHFETEIDGPFAAMEQPELFVQDVRRFFGTLRPLARD